jgi:hypothetical protein
MTVTTILTSTSAASAGDARSLPPIVTPGREPGYLREVSCDQWYHDSFARRFVRCGLPKYADPRIVLAGSSSVISSLQV